MDVVVAIEGAEVPGECEDAAPEGIVHQLTEYTIHIGRLDPFFSPRVYCNDSPTSSKQK